MLSGELPFLFRSFVDASDSFPFILGPQETNILSVMTMGKSSAEYLQARATTFRLGATEGIDAVLDKYQLDALLLPAEDGATGPAAVVSLSPFDS